MSRSNAGTYSTPAGQPVVSGTTINSATFNTLVSDLAAEITDSASRSGKGGFTAPVRAADGTLAAPSFSFTSETGSGLYRISAGLVGVAMLGVKVLEITSAVTRGALRLIGQATPSAPSDGEIWYDTTVSPPRFAGRLNGITSTTLVVPGLNANWSAAGGLSYWLSPDGTVRIKGSAVSAGGAGFNIFTLPAGYRPAATRWLCGADESLATIVQINIATSGVVSINNGFVAGHTYSLDGISFLAEA